MSHEINDTSGIQLRDSRTQPKVSLSREIGEARIVHTIFGRAKVRIIRQEDKYRRAIWLTVLLAAVAASAAIWQEWYAAEQTQPAQNAESALSTAGGNETAPAPQFENYPLPSAVATEPGNASPNETSDSGFRQQRVPQPELAAETVPVAAKPKPAMLPPKPVTVQRPSAASLPTDKPQTPQVAANGNVSNVPPIQPQIKTVPLKQQVPLVAASNATAAPALASPIGKDDAPAQAPIAEKQLSAPISGSGN